MQIPVVPLISDKDKNLYTGTLSFDNGVPKINGQLTRYTKPYQSVNRKCPVLIVDVTGLQNRTIDNTVLKHLKNRGSKVWFITHIQCADDVFDAFNTDADMVIFPFHTLNSLADLNDIMSVSDSVVPAIFIQDGKPIGERSINDVIDTIYDAGFSEIAVFDTDCSLSYDDWKEIVSYGNTVPYSKRFHESIFENLGMLLTFTDLQ